MPPLPRFQKGFSLIELLLVLGVLAILLIAAFIVYPQVRQQNLINKEIVALNAAYAKLQNVYSGPTAGRCQSAPTATMQALKLFPERVYDTTTLRYPSPIASLGVQTVSSATSRTVNFNYRGLDKDMCIKFASAALAGYKVRVQLNYITGIEDQRLLMFCSGGNPPAVPLTIEIPC